MSRATLRLLWIFLIIVLVTGTTQSDSPIMDENFHPNLLNRTANSSEPVMHYDNSILPLQLREAINHIDFQVSNKTTAQVLVFFSQNPGSVNITISRITTDFIMSRPEWTGNYTKESVNAMLFMNWAEETMRVDPTLKRIYPFYLKVFKNNTTGSLYPVKINYWYQVKNKPVIRYSAENIPPDISRYVETIDFQTDNSTTAQVKIYLQPDIGIVGLIPSVRIGEFIMSRPEWIGDRSNVSVITEIWVHWFADNLKLIFQREPISDVLYNYFVIGSEDNRISAVYPVHLSYFNGGLNATPVIDPILKRM